jgi:hypothetical protein
MRLAIWVGIIGLGTAALSAEAQDRAADALSATEARGIAFLSKMRLADPDYQIFLMACLKSRELNVLLSGAVSPREIPVLLKGLAGQLSRDFPGEDLVVIAFRPVIPLREAGIARLQGLNGVVTYQGP